MNHIDHKATDGLPQKIIIAFIQAILYKWAVYLWRFLYKKYREEKGQPRIIYVRRTTMLILILGCLGCAVVSLGCVVYLIATAPTPSENGIIINFKYFKILEEKAVQWDSLHVAKK